MYNGYMRERKELLIDRRQVTHRPPEGAEGYGKWSQEDQPEEAVLLPAETMLADYSLHSNRVCRDVLVHCVLPEG